MAAMLLSNMRRSVILKRKAQNARWGKANDAESVGRVAQIAFQVKIFDVMIQPLTNHRTRKELTR